MGFLSHFVCKDTLFFRKVLFYSEILLTLQPEKLFVTTSRHVKTYNSMELPALDDGDIISSTNHLRRDHFRSKG